MKNLKFIAIIFFLYFINSNCKLYAESKVKTVDLEISTGAYIPLVFSEHNFTGLKLQSGLNFEFGISAVFLNSIILTSDFKLEIIGDSLIDNNLLLKSYISFGPNFNFGYRFLLKEKDLNTYFFGLSLGGGLNFSFNIYGGNYFFYPSLNFNLWSDIYFNKSFYTLSIYIPSEVKFRKDLNYSILIGIGCKIKFSNFVH